MSVHTQQKKKKNPSLGEYTTKKNLPKTATGWVSRAAIGQADTWQTTEVWLKRGER